MEKALLFINHQHFLRLESFAAQSSEPYLQFLPIHHKLN